MFIKLNIKHSLHFGAFRRNRMKAAILLLICLAVVTVTHAGHHQHDRNDRRQDNRDDRRRDSRENDEQNRSQDNRQDSRENNEQDKRQDNRRDNRQEDRNADRQDSRQDIRQDRRQDSRERNEQGNRRDNRQEGRNDDRQDRRQEDRRQNRRQDIREKNEQDRRQDSSENRGQENRQPWRDLFIENRGKIVNNGVQRDGQQSYTQKQELLDQLGYTQTIDRRATTTNMDTLLKQKFLLSILLNVNDVATEEQLEELGQTLILDEQKYIGSLDDDMRHLVQLCVDGQMLRKTENFNGLNAAHLRQLHGLYKLLVSARDWETFKRNTCFARLHLNRVLLVNALLLAVKERQDTQILVMPAMNEILPELFNDKQLLQVSRNINLADLLTESTTRKPQLNDFIGRLWGRPVTEDNTNLGQQRWGGMQAKKTWQEWRQEKLDRQVGRVAAPTTQNDLHKLVVTVPISDDTRSEDLNKRISYLTQDVGLSNFWYSLNMDCLRQMRLPTTERNEMEARNSLSDENQRKEDQINELNNERLLHTNRRRWKQNQDQTSNEEDMRQKVLRTKQIIGSDAEQTEELKRQRQAENNKDDLHSKAKHGRLIVEALLRALGGERREIDAYLESSKSRGLKDNSLSEDKSEQEQLLRDNRRRLNKSLESREDSREIDKINRRDSDEQLRQDGNEKVRSWAGNRNEGNHLLKTNRRRLNQPLGLQQDSRETSRKDRDESRVDKDSSEEIRRNPIEDERLLKVNRRWLNTKNMLRGDMDDLERKQRKMKEQKSDEKRRQDSDELVRNDSIEQRRQDPVEQIRRDSDEDIRMRQINFIDEERPLSAYRRWLKRRNMLGTKLDKLNIGQMTLEKERREDSSEERLQDSDEQSRQNSDEKLGMLDRNPIDDQRLLRVNRRWLNRSNMLGTNLDKLNIAQRTSRAQGRQDSSEERLRDSDEQRRQDSDENMAMLGRNSIDDQRLLRVNRRWLNRRNMLGTNLDKLNKEQRTSREQRRQDSSEERKRDADEQRRQDSDENVDMLERNSIDDQRLLRINRRWLKARNMLGENLDNQQISQRLRELQESSEERRQVEKELKRQDAADEIDTNSIEDKPVSNDNRRRLDQNSRRTANGNKSIWPQRNQDNQQIDQKMANKRDSKEITRRDSDEIIGLLRNKLDRLRKLNHRNGVTQRSLESSSQEDSNEQNLNSNVLQKFSEVSSEESSEERNEAPTNVRLLAIGRRRLPRSADSQLSEKLELSELRTGEMKLANMQQMLARLRLERLSHQLEEVLASKQQKNPDIRREEGLNRRSMETRDNRQLQMQIQNVQQILKTIIAEELQLVSSEDEIKLKQSNVLELIGRILMNRISNSGLNVFELWSHLMEVASDNNNSLMNNMAQQLREPAFGALMESILNIVDSYSDKLPSYDSQLLRLDDVQLNDVKVDKLQTYFDSSDVDLINSLDQQALRAQNIELKNIQSTPVARQQRLNHKSFSLKLDISSKRERRVVIRTFLGPKLDSNGKELSLNDNRRNFMLVDAFTSDLLPGQNSIKRKSSDISWTSRDSTPLSQLYREVMLAIDGSNDLQLEHLNGNNRRFPHRLLLPRGLPQGLPMQLYIIVTPQSEQDASLQRELQTKSAILGMGTAAIGLDTLPLGFPLDRRIDNEQNILVPNAILKDVAIYHDGEIEI